jgi:exodeoxyribonuclease V alpha subunit
VPFHRAETSLAAALLRLSSTPADRMPGFATVDWGKALAWLRARIGAELAAEEEQAVRLALTAKVAVLTGGPGCGKSFTVKSVITLACVPRNSGGLEAMILGLTCEDASRHASGACL